MTNPEMVRKPKAGAAERPLPEPNVAPPQPMLAPESEPEVFTTEEPLDSPQPKPMIRQDKTKGLGVGRRSNPRG
jgi:hypothetical protein